ncbi:hypothetical protein ACFY0P_46680 [Streptomyces sp. NPDC001714]|uniref:hypothetical protein n=1 Tax=Streptomyces sp. NPDC001714 TaxID=3364603 RepID=UPI0036CD5BCC
MDEVRIGVLALFGFLSIALTHGGGVGGDAAGAHAAACLESAGVRGYRKTVLSGATAAHGWLRPAGTPPGVLLSDTG